MLSASQELTARLLIVSKAIILGTGPSLEAQKPDIERLQKQGYKLFGVNNTYMDFDLDVWIACDHKWHEIYSPVKGDFDKWHWDKQICERYDYEYIEGRWGDGPNKCSGLETGGKIAYGHSSGFQALNLAVYYGAKEIYLAGYDMYYTPERRHYFRGLSDSKGEYPEVIRKNSTFQGLIECYETIPRCNPEIEIYNATRGSALKCFPFRYLEEL